MSCLVFGLVAGCSEPEPPILVEPQAVTVSNQTSRDWTNVLIRVNDHFTGGVPLLKAGGRANAPLSQFATAYGQRWEARHVVRKVEVKAESADGNPVSLVWEQGQMKSQR